MLPGFKKITPTDYELSKVQSNTADAFSNILTKTILDGREVSANLTAGTALEINHQLGRQPVGWIIIDTTAAGTVHRTAWNSSSITLLSSSSTTLKLWVF